MKKTAAFLLCVFVLTVAHGQYKNDNVLYKTLYWDKICSELNLFPGYLILDVRSRGEFNDTSSYKALNIGHLKGAKNIPVQELDKRVGEIMDYKDKPVFVYCSHSQRSRRACKMLADSGFTKLYNVNGGLTDYYMDDNLVKNRCLRDLAYTKNKYQFLSVSAVCKILTEDKEAFVLDVRSDAAWQHKDSNAKWNAFGNFKKAVHIPVAELYANLSALPRDQQIILTDLEGEDVIEAAELLTEKGFKKVGVLMDGISRWYITPGKEQMCNAETFVRAVPYSIIGIKEFIDRIQTRAPYVLIDTRKASEFANTDETKWKNLGHMKTAINIPAAELQGRLTELEPYQTKNVLLYAGGNSSELYAVADSLTAHGFKNIYVLGQGIFDVRWMAANVKGMEYLMPWVADAPE